MPLMKGFQLGPYEILDPIGAGGMGEVYRARDARLGRDVAIKVLPETFARDVEKLSRFQREAKMLAALNHPNIASIYGFEDSGNVHALVMELVEGPTLADRIARGAIPVEEALPIAKQIAEAVEYAHERGIIHRDLKPANIKVGSNDAVKILDFGLAKALDADASQGDISSSPTITHMATQAGIILGTAAYMSPEQAKGKAVDRRTDIWAFGCVLYEMLTGKMAFSGESITETLAAVIREEPDWSLLPPDTPPAIRNLLARCLKKDARQRLQSIGDARIAIEEVLSGSPSQAESSLPIVERTTRGNVIAWSAAILFALVASGLGIWIATRPPPEEQPQVLAYIPPPVDTSYRDLGYDLGLVVVSPDGKQLAFTAEDKSDVTKLWVRPLSSNEAKPIAGTDGAAGPFWSPDSQSVAFFAGNKLETVELDDGNIQILTDSQCDLRGAWSKTGTILFTPDCSGPLDEIASSGGNPRPVGKLEDGEMRQVYPTFLPGGRNFLYASFGKDYSSSIWAGSLDSSEKKLVVKDAQFPEYSSGYLLYVVGETHVLAQQFDPASETLTGKPIPMAESHGFSVSENGVLAYQGGTLDSRPEWFDRNGNSVSAIGDVGTYDGAKISPDGKRVLLNVFDPQSNADDLWTFPASGGVGTRLTFGPGAKLYAVWSPDGKYVSYACGPRGHRAICRKPADGSGAEETMSTFPAVDFAAPTAVDWSPDGRYISFTGLNRSTALHETWVLPVAGDQKPFQPVALKVSQYSGVFSPDGHWFAYFSYESGGLPQVYVEQFPGPGAKYQISQNGGWSPRWDKKGHLYFLTMGNRLMEADLTMSDKSIQVKALQPLFDVDVPGYTAPFFDVTPDGSRFVVITSADPTASRSITVLLNWQAALKKE
jgi:eukaryotic-like serine/threonine-protein kinase